MDEIIKELVKMADRFDNAGQTKLAAAVDETILSLAARPKSNKPLKKMDDKVKDELFKFLGCVCNDMTDSVKALEELMRRLRYFNVDGEVKGLKLPDMLKEVKELSDKINGATHKMYEMAFGRKLPKEYLKSLKKEDKKEQDAEDPFSFARITDEQKDLMPDRMVPDEDVSYTGTNKEAPTHEEMDEFWGGKEPAFEDDANDGQSLKQASDMPMVKSEFYTWEKQLMKRLLGKEFNTKKELASIGKEAFNEFLFSLDEEISDAEASEMFKSAEKMLNFRDRIWNLFNA
jgi:hypothetical protein